MSHDLIGRLPIKTIVPITGWSKIELNKGNGLKKDSSIDCFGIRSFSTRRFIKRVGSVDEDFLFQVHKMILKTLNPKYKI